MTKAENDQELHHINSKNLLPYLTGNEEFSQLKNAIWDFQINKLGNYYAKKQLYFFYSLFNLDLTTNTNRITIAVDCVVCSQECTTSCSGCLRAMHIGCNDVVNKVEEYKDVCIIIKAHF